MNMRKCFLLLVASCLTANAAGCSFNKKDSEEKKEIKTFTSLLMATATEIDTTDNRLQKKIAEKTGAICKETWIQTTDNTTDIVNKMIISGEYPDFIYSNNAYHHALMEANAFIPIDEYWDDCENLKNYFSASEWDRIRAEDGHIYIVPSFSNAYLYDTNTVHDDEAFWIQVKVLKWAGYPKITTMDEYFSLLERYLAANPKGENGKANIGYEILTDGWLYFCLENPPQFLDGYPNDGCCIVDKDKLEAVDYNTTPTAKRWFKKLNEEYRKGIIDPDCFVMTAEQYYAKLTSGNVLGMVDQQWNFAPHVKNLSPESQYVPLGIVIDKGIEEHYHSEVALDTSQGMGISVSCTDIQGALHFLDMLLDPEVLNLRFWGEAGIDYSIGEDGIFYLTPEQRQNFNDEATYNKNRCPYFYFPYYKGMNQDGINAFNPTYQPSEFFKTLDSSIQECLSAYGARTYVEMLNKTEPNAPWFPMWSVSNAFTAESAEGKAKLAMDTIKHKYLPLVVMSDDFETSWDEYMDAYEKNCDTKSYLAALTKEIKRCAAQYQ